MYKKLVGIILIFLFSINLSAMTPPTLKNVTKLYVATFNRAPDAAGLDYWLYDSGLDLEGIARSFFEQPETQEKYPPGTTLEEFIKLVYNNLFNRDPKENGLEYWKEQLGEGVILRSEFILAVMNGAMGDDETILSNKAEVGEYFALNGLNDAQEAKKVIELIDATPESVERAEGLIDDIVNGNYDYNSNTTDDSVSGTPGETEVTDDNSYSSEDKPTHPTTESGGRDDDVSGTTGEEQSNNIDSSDKNSNSATSESGGRDDTSDIVIPPNWSEEEARALDYLNKIRESLGMKDFKANDKLHTAAVNHSKYQVFNDEMTHIETEGEPYFTGKYPWDRTDNAGYQGLFVGENIDSYMGYKDNIDNLFTAIYHRKGFLDFNYDEIGIGQVTDNAGDVRVMYTYDMASSTYSNKEPNKDYVIFPVKKLDTYIFLGEIPDPIPGYSFAGNPVSIFFNPYNVDCSSIQMDSFKLIDLTENKEVPIIKILTTDNDPNNMLSDCDFALFPSEIEKFGHQYEAIFQYEDSSGSNKISWIFDISLPENSSLDHILDAKEGEESFNINKGEVYYLLVEPTQDYPYIQSVNYSSDNPWMNYSFYDYNTLKIEVPTDSPSGNIDININNSDTIVHLLVN